MGRPPRDADGATQRARAQLIETTDAEALRIAQATLLPLLGLSLDMTAEVVGRSRWWVSQARGRFLRGEPLVKHGGRRRSMLAVDMELALVKLAVRQAELSFGHPRKTIRGELHKLLEPHSLETISESFLTDLLNRTIARLLPGANLQEFHRVAHALARIWELEATMAKRASTKTG